MYVYFAGLCVFLMLGGVPLPGGCSVCHARGHWSRAGRPEALPGGPDCSQTADWPSYPPVLWKLPQVRGNKKNAVAIVCCMHSAHVQSMQFNVYFLLTLPVEISLGFFALAVWLVSCGRGTGLRAYAGPWVLVGRFFKVMLRRVLGVGRVFKVITATLTTETLKSC